MQKLTVNHPKYGEIVYSESTFWGIPFIEINGVKLEKQKKKPSFSKMKEKRSYAI